MERSQKTISGLNFLIGIDLGTTNVKAAAITQSGAILAQYAQSIPTLFPQPGYAAQNPVQIWKTVIQVVKKVYRSVREQGELTGIIFSSAMHSMLAVDATGQPLTNAWLWSDTRAAAIADTLRNSEKGMELYLRTGVPIHAMSPLFKLIWLRNNEPDIFRQTHKIVGINNFVVHQLTGEYVTDCSTASATGFLNTLSNTWDAFALDLAQITADLLPAVQSPHYQVFLPKNNAFGLPQNTPCFLGASDGALANLGSGAVAAHQLAITVGTSAAVRIMSNTPFLEAHGRTFCYRLDDERFILGGASNNGANVLSWLRNNLLCTKLPIRQLFAEAAMIAAGCDGLRCTPYLYGERAPIWDAQASGSFEGITARHTRGHFVRATLEGIAQNIHSIAQLLPMYPQCTEIIASGGLMQSNLFVEMIQAQFGLPVKTSTDGDASVRGAVLLGFERKN